MYSHNEVSNNNINNGFSPWEQWTPETTVCFHDRVAEGIRHKELSADKIAAVVSRLLTKANEVSLALLKEIRYADSPPMCAFNTESLIAVQRNISKIRNLLKGRNVDDLPAGLSPGKIMLHKYSEIINECYAMVSSLNIFDYEADAVLHNVRSAFVAKILVLLANVIDAMQQCDCAVRPLEYMVHNKKELASAVSRANQAMRIVINALNSAVIPGRDERRLSVEKSSLLTDASILVSMLKLLDLASRRAFSRQPAHTIDMLRTPRIVQHCCVFRILSIRAKVKKYMRPRGYYIQINKALCSAVWALDRLYDEVCAISSGMYSYMGRRMHYATKMSQDITECATILTLLCIAYERTGETGSSVAKVLEQEKDIACSATLCCLHLEKRYTRNASSSGTGKLQDILMYLDSICGRLRDIDMSQLLHQQWSSSMLIQAIKCADRALDSCISKLKSVGERTEKKVRTEYKDLQGTPCNVLDFPQEALNQIDDCRGGGGYSGPGSTCNSVTSPSSSLEDVIEHSTQDLPEARQNSHSRHPTP